MKHSISYYIFCLSFSVAIPSFLVIARCVALYFLQYCLLFFFLSTTKRQALIDCSVRLPSQEQRQYAFSELKRFLFAICDRDRPSFYHLVLLACPYDSVVAEMVYMMKEDVRIACDGLKRELEEEVRACPSFSLRSGESDREESDNISNDRTRPSSTVDLLVLSAFSQDCFDCISPLAERCRYRNTLISSPEVVISVLNFYRFFLLRDKKWRETMMRKERIMEESDIRERIAMDSSIHNDRIDHSYGEDHNDTADVEYSANLVVTSGIWSAKWREHIQLQVIQPILGGVSVLLAEKTRLLEDDVLQVRTQEHEGKSSQIVKYCCIMIGGGW